MIFRCWLVVICIFGFLQPTRVLAAKNITVGVYNNSPKVFFDENNNPQGFWVDVVSAIAQKERGSFKGLY